jgi:LuxR family quorum-sensing system transcriptional regulator CciR
MVKTPTVEAGRIWIEEPFDISRAATFFRNVVAQMADLRVAATHNIAGRVPMRDAEGNLLATTIFGWNQSRDQWWEDRRFALRTPIAEACRIESQPFWANRQGAWNRSGQRILEDFDFSYYGKLVSHAASIVVPVHLPFSRIGMVAFSCAADIRSNLSNELMDNFESLYLLSHLFIDSYARLDIPDRWLPAPVTLTKLEVNCLRWVGRGKTDDEIAIITGRARPTIRFHLQNAALKLGSTNRAQTVFRAAQLGYLSPSPAPKTGEIGEKRNELVDRI